MTEEKADQIIRCVKECWWRVGVLLSLGLLFILLVMHGWPQGDWGLGWGALGALATSVTGYAAVLIAYRQKKSNDEFGERLDWMARREANYLLNEINHELTCVIGKTKALLKPENQNVATWLKTLGEVIEIRKRLSREGVRFDSKYLLNGEYMDALFDLKIAISELDNDSQNINLEEAQSKVSDLLVVAVWLQNELMPLLDVVEKVGQGFECMGLEGIKEIMVRRFRRIISEVQETWLPSEKV